MREIREVRIRQGGTERTPGGFKRWEGAADHKQDDPELGLALGAGDACDELPAALAGEADPAGLEADVAVARGDLCLERRCGGIQAAAGDLQAAGDAAIPVEFIFERPLFGWDEQFPGVKDDP